MTTVASPYKYAPAKARTSAWRLARYQRAFLKSAHLLKVVVNPHASRAELSAAIVEARHALEEAQAVLNREANQ